MLKGVFQEFCSGMEIDGCIVKKISKNRDEITDLVSEYYSFPNAKVSSQFMGAYGRNTAVYTENIRLLIAIPLYIYTSISLDNIQLLRQINTVLRTKFRSSDFSDVNTGLEIHIDDSLGFNIIPGFAYDNETYIYLSRNEWKVLNLGNERKRFDEVNRKTHNNLLDLCRMLKVWKNYKDLDIENILLDTFAYHFFSMSGGKCYSVDAYDEMLTDFFRFLLKNCKDSGFISIDGKTVLQPPAGLRDAVFYAYTTANTALEEAKLLYIEDAFTRWRKIFGTFYLQNCRP
ncbi:MAG: hypothetical protein LIO79_09705 [Rikenellaceae bacterium]|nr:hypothetical protein [Rikenellaceae bacterium]